MFRYGKSKIKINTRSDAVSYRFFECRGQAASPTNNNYHWWTNWWWKRNEKERLRIYMRGSYLCNFRFTSSHESVCAKGRRRKKTCGRDSCHFCDELKLEKNVRNCVVSKWNISFFSIRHTVALYEIFCSFRRMTKCHNDDESDQKWEQTNWNLILSPSILIHLVLICSSIVYNISFILLVQKEKKTRNSDT